MYLYLEQFGSQLWLMRASDGLMQIPDITIIQFKAQKPILKGTGSREEYFLKAYKIESVLYLHAHLVFRKKFWLPCRGENIRTYIKIVLGSMKALINFKDCPRSRIIISIPSSLSVIGRFSPLSTSHQMQEKYTGDFRYEIS